MPQTKENPYKTLYGCSYLFFFTDIVIDMLNGIEILGF